MPVALAETVHRLEAITIAVFAPIFFASVGLKVDFTKVQGAAWPAIVVGSAVLGKVVGCTAGGLLGRMSFVESLVLGCGMSARGAMELVVAMIGLTLGVITPELFDDRRADGDPDELPRAAHDQASASAAAAPPPSAAP